MICKIFFKASLPLSFIIHSSVALASSWAFQQIETEQAQELARGQGVTIAVIDTGVDTRHSDLQESLWKNPGESGQDFKGRPKSSNGLDDDGNGFIDDLHGWNFVTESSDVRDDHGHGTHIAGLIAGRNKDGFGQHGVAPEARLMILKYYDAKASPWKNLVNSIRAFRYAIRMKAQIINYSGGGPGWNDEEVKVLRQAESQSILIVAAAGNQGINTEFRKYYPADYPLSNILSVTATDQKRKLAGFANFNPKSVGLAAPGADIVSTLPEGLRGEMSGTSQATALATGVAALILSQRPVSNPAQLIRQISETSVVEKSLQGKVKNSGSINAFRALAMKTNTGGAAGLAFEADSTNWKEEQFLLKISLLDERTAGRQGSLNDRGH